MEFGAKEKRKNDLRGGFPWWMLLVAFALGVVLTFAVTQPRTSQPIAVGSDTAFDEMMLTATAIINGATATANAAEMSAAAEMDAIFATATAVVAQATQQSSP
jgi:hypothetical protein